MRSAALLSLALLTGCADKENDSGFESSGSGDLSTQECLVQIDGAREGTELLLTHVWEDGGNLFFELDGNQDDLRCFIDYGEEADQEAQRRGSAWVTPMGGSQMYLGCARSCDVWEPIADCRGGFGCDTPSSMVGSTVVQISE